MLSLLDPRIWLAAVIAAAITFGSGFVYGEHKQKRLDTLEKTAEIAAANQEARKFEQKRQTNVDEAAKVRAASEQRLVADARNASVSVNGLHNDLDAVKRASEKSLAASQSTLGVASELLDRCTNKYLGMAENAQRADSEARELRSAWPK